MKAQKAAGAEAFPGVAMIHVPLAVAMLALLCPLAWPQSLVYLFEGDPGDNMLNVSGAGDVNADGFADVIASGGGSGGAGIVRVYSGRDGSILHTWQGTASSQTLGARIAGAGDVNGDGHADLIVGALDSPNGHLSGSARVFSGKDGSLLHWFHGDAPGDRFFVVAGAGDVNGDGYADLIVGGSHSDAAGPDFGIVKVFSGFDGSVLHVFHGTASLEGFGDAVAGAGDVNGDGHADLVVAAPNSSSSSGNGFGRIVVYSGLDGTILYTRFGPWPMSFFGRSIDGAGDVNGDGHPDLIVGAPGFADVGRVHVLSGLDGSVLYDWFGTDIYASFGGFVAGMGDLNGDGYPDLGATSHSGSGTGTALFFSGRDGSLLYTLGPETVGQAFLRLGGAGDVTGNGYGDIVLGGFNKVSVYSGHEHIVSYCFGDGSGAACPCGNPGGEGEGCASSSGMGAVLTGTGSASIGNDDLAFHASQLLPGQPALLFAGGNAVNGGNGVHFGDGLRCAGGDVQRLGVQLPDAAGNASYDPSPSLRELVPGDIRRYQVWYRDPVGGPCGTGFNLTNGVEVAFSL